MNNQFTRSLVIVDDEAIIRTLLSERLSRLGFQCFVAHDALAAKRLVLAHDPDALIVDLDLGEGPSGTELIVALAELNPELGFVLLSNYKPAPSELKVATNLRYVNKSEVHDIQILLEALESVLRQGKQKAQEFAEGQLSKLTKGQLEVLSMLAKGSSNSEIAAKRSVSVRAVEQSVRRIYLSLGLTKMIGQSRRVTAARMYSSEMGLRRGSQLK